MSFLQLVLSLDKTKEEIILLWRICQFDRYRNRRDGSAAMLAAKRLVGVAPEVNLMEYVPHMLLPIVNKADHSGFETQRRHHQKTKTGVSVAPQKGPTSSKKFKKQECIPVGCIPPVSRGVSGWGGVACMPPAMHALPPACMPPAMHTPQPRMSPSHAHPRPLACPPDMHAPQLCTPPCEQNGKQV